MKNYNFSTISLFSIFLLFHGNYAANIMNNNNAHQKQEMSDREFLKSMIPHHEMAISMCQEASLQDNEIKELCKNIIATQQSEINFMKKKLEGMKH